jgi:flagellar protein FlaG
MNTIANTTPPVTASISAPATGAPADNQAQARPQIAPPVAPDLPSRKPSVIAIDTSGTSSASVRESAQPIEKVVQAAANAIQEFIQSQGGNLSISVDAVTGYHVIRVTDNNGNEVMTLPSDAAIRIAHNMQSLQGLLVNQTA